MKKYCSNKLIRGEKIKLKDGASPLGLVIRKAGKRKIIFLGISAFPRQWNKEFQLYVVDERNKGLHPDKGYNNSWLSDIKKRSNKIIGEFEEKDID